MTATSLLEHLRSKGVTVVPDGDLLRCRPKSALTDEDLARLKELKTEVLAALQPSVPAPARVTCHSCRGTRFWRSSYNVAVCARCHPPAGPRLVAAWIGPDAGSTGGDVD